LSAGAAASCMAIGAVACPETIGLGCVAAGICAYLNADVAVSNGKEAVTARPDTPAVASLFSAATGVSPETAEQGQNFLAAVTGIGAAGSVVNQLQQMRGPTAVVFTPAAPPLASVLQGFGARQGFTGVFDSRTGGILIRPSTYDDLIPQGWVAARGGHGQVSAQLGGSRANHHGFAVILQQNGSLNVSWRSLTLNGRTDGLVPQQMRQRIVNAVEMATGRKVNF
jgi:hypothetical protein